MRALVLLPSHTLTHPITDLPPPCFLSVHAPSHCSLWFLVLYDTTFRLPPVPDCGTRPRQPGLLGAATYAAELLAKFPLGQGEGALLESSFQLWAARNHNRNQIDEHVSITCNLRGACFCPVHRVDHGGEIGLGVCGLGLGDHEEELRHLRQPEYPVALAHQYLLEHVLLRHVLDTSVHCHDILVRGHHLVEHAVEELVRLGAVVPFALD
mmetsp:Transcript_26979/g.63809  ORF Transcript_26979/g.63809 Transcript_26979/m.63809 type:complete len:210 (+) Transcript_26979:26-655(+)